MQSDQSSKSIVCLHFPYSSRVRARAVFPSLSMARIIELLAVPSFIVYSVLLFTGVNSLRRKC